MSQKISTTSLRLYNYKGFTHNMYTDLYYMPLWQKNNIIYTRYKQIIQYTALLKLRRKQINRRLRLKNNMCVTPLNVLVNSIISNVPYKSKLNSFIFKKPLVGVQFSYSIRPVQRRFRHSPNRAKTRKGFKT